MEIVRFWESFIIVPTCNLQTNTAIWPCTLWKPLESINSGIPLHSHQVGLRVYIQYPTCNIQFLVRLKTIRILDGSNFPSNEGIAKQSAKNAHRVIENKKEIIEFYADSIIQGISFIFTIAVLYFAYVLFEQESKEKEAEAKRLTKLKINRIKGELYRDPDRLVHRSLTIMIRYKLVCL